MVMLARKGLCCSTDAILDAPRLRSRQCCKLKYNCCILTVKEQLSLRLAQIIFDVTPVRARVFSRHFAHLQTQSVTVPSRDLTQPVLGPWGQKYIINYPLTSNYNLFADALPPSFPYLFRRSRDALVWLIFPNRQARDAVICLFFQNEKSLAMDNRPITVANY